MTVFGRKLATAGIALVGVSAIAIAPTVQHAAPACGPGGLSGSTRRGDCSVSG